MPLSTPPQSRVFVPAERHRKRRWSRAERERAAEKQRDDSCLYNLTLDVNALRQEIRGASQQRAAAETRARATREAAEKDLRELATQFARLLVDQCRPSSCKTCSSPVSLSSLFTLEDAAFVTTHLHERLALNAQHVGRLGLLSQTRALSQLFQLRAAQLQSMRVLADDVASLNGAPSRMIAECHFELTGRLTRQSIEMAFPSARQHPELASEALEYASPCLECDLRAVLFVESRRNVIVACDLTLHLLTSLLAVLPRAGLHGVAKMLDGAPFDAFGLLVDTGLVQELSGKASSMDQQGKEDEEPTQSTCSVSLSPLSINSLTSPHDRHSIGFILSPTAAVGARTPGGLSSS